MYVSVSAFNDAAVLRGCLESIDEHLPDAHVAVVDGAYKTWPGDAENSTDETDLVAFEYGASYHPEGPFERERNKHLRRVDLAPDGEQTLFLDADERLVCADFSQLAANGAYQPRIHNPIVYGNRVAYWPRIFDPATVESVNRWDAYQFRAPEPPKVDSVTIAHRADLRPDSYRREKLDRLDAEGRSAAAYYADVPESYVSLDLEFDTRDDPCPDCGEHAVVQSVLTPYGDGDERDFSRVETCVNGDCWTGIEAVRIEEFEYLPEHWREGFERDPHRLRAELIAAGCDFIRGDGIATFERMYSLIEMWVEDEFGEAESGVFA